MVLEHLSFLRRSTTPGQPRRQDARARVQSTTIPARTDARVRCCFVKGHPDEGGLASAHGNDIRGRDRCSETHCRVLTNDLDRLFVYLKMPLTLGAMERSTNVSASRETILSGHFLQSKATYRGLRFWRKSLPSKQSRHLVIADRNSDFKRKKPRVGLKPHESPDRGTNLGYRHGLASDRKHFFVALVAIGRLFGREPFTIRISEWSQHEKSFVVINGLL